ncbi:MAG TPA: 2-oxoglutarate dehydrogenase, E2 component, dihydrolipoamide succinyltransferase [Propionibacteriaceae bacterium]|jgi:2-oxoglutarate dehydrogenase E2 component (dihydrolipoamide succinyltransferase)|nr:2-oxoglutarate dehydrogenase, E2 component, dihydrolipoamide succinyltransferase [Propionibacteriaceae bacterium]
MSTSVTLPALGESVTEGTVSRWLKQVGDTVEADEPLLEVSTDKVDTEIPSPTSGVLLEIKAQEDETVEVGAVLAVIGDPSEADGQAAPAPEAPAEQAAEEPAQEEAEAPAHEEAAPAESPEEPEKTEAAAEAPEEPAAPAATSGPAAGTEVTLPELGESVTEGTVSRWLKQVGESVAADESLLEVSTDKVDTEIPSPTSGTLLEIRVQEDETVEVGAVLAVIGEAGAATAPSPEPEPAPEPGRQPEPQAPAEAETRPAPQPASRVAAPPAKEDARPEQHGPAATATAAPTPVVGDSEAGYVTPLVRKLAKEHGVDLVSLNGTGVGGRIRKQDVLAAAETAKQAAETAKQAAPAPQAEPAAAAAPAPAAAASALRGTTERMSRLRQTIAKRMVESLQVSAQLTATVEVDLTAISQIRAKVKEDFKKREGATLSYLPFIAKAAIEALKVHPKLNATIDTEERTITYPDAEHLGIAVDTEKGLLVPVIKDAGDLSITGLAKRIADLAARTRQNKVTPDELTGGTFTITNYGSAGTLMDTPIINQPQVAILGTGALVRRPVVISDPRLGQVIAIRDMMYLSASYDHRLVDGAEAARFLSTLKARLEEGDFGGEFGL